MCEACQRLRLAPTAFVPGRAFTVIKMACDQGEIEIAGAKRLLIRHAIEDHRIGRRDEVGRADFLYMVGVINEGESLMVAGDIAETGRSPRRAEHIEQSVDLLAFLLYFLNRDDIEMR